MTTRIKFCELNVGRCRAAQAEFLDRLDWDVVVLCEPYVPLSNRRCPGYSVLSGAGVAVLVLDDLALDLVSREDAFAVVRLGILVLAGVYFSPHEQYSQFILSNN